MLCFSSFCVSSESLFSSSDPDDILWDPNESATTQPTTIDDFVSELDLTNFDASAVDPIFFANDDSNENLFASTPSQNRCDAAAEASNLNLEARDVKSSCQTNSQESSSPPPIHKKIQLFSLII